jgi:hypothetical protein
MIAVLEGLLPGQRIVEGPFRVLKDLEDGARVRELGEDDADVPGDGGKKKKRTKAGDKR